MAGLCLYGLHRYVILFLAWRHRGNAPGNPPLPDVLPVVTVQLPIFNEPLVVRRLLGAVSKLDYPRDRLEIQILDDSTDETRQITRAEADRMRSIGLDVTLIQRTERTGFKAGALAEGLRIAKGELIYILDADFVPPPDALQQLPGHFFEDDRIGMVQTRWGHLNREASILTRVQSIFLDGHFQLEQSARSRSGRFFHFNGTAGMWRKRCIEDAGGWTNDTLTEDLDLSLRAQLRGWKFVYRNDLVTPAELPSEMSGFKSQQHRWAKGAIQNCRKLLGPIWRSPVAPLRAKIEATIQLTCNFTYLLMAALCLLVFPAPGMEQIEWAWIAYLVIFWMTTGAVLLFYTCSTRRLYPKTWTVDLLHLPMALALGAGMCVNNSRGVIEALLGRRSDFVRTPKFGDKSRSGRALTRPQRAPSLTNWIEGALTLYFSILAANAIWNQWWTAAPFLLLFAIGFGYVSRPGFQSWLAASKSEIHPSETSLPRNRGPQQLLAQPAPPADELRD